MFELAGGLWVRFGTSRECALEIRIGQAEGDECLVCLMRIDGHPGGVMLSFQEAARLVSMMEPQCGALFDSRLLWPLLLPAVDLNGDDATQDRKEMERHLHRGMVPYIMSEESFERMMVEAKFWKGRHRNEKIQDILARAGIE